MSGKKSALEFLTRFLEFFMGQLVSVFAVFCCVQSFDKIQSKPYIQVGYNSSLGHEMLKASLNWEYSAHQMAFIYPAPYSLLLI